MTAVNDVVVLDPVNNDDKEIKATVEYRFNKPSTAQVNKHFQLSVTIPTEMRNSLRCDLLIKAPNGGTTGLNKHLKACIKKITKPESKSKNDDLLPSQNHLNWSYQKVLN